MLEETVGNRPAFAPVSETSSPTLSGFSAEAPDIIPEANRYTNGVGKTTLIHFGCTLRGSKVGDVTAALRLHSTRTYLQR